MSEQNRPTITDKDELRLIELDGKFEISPLNDPIDLGDVNRYVRIDLTPEEKIHTSALLSQMPLAAVAGSMPQLYTVSFPEGLPHTLMRLKRGGFSTPIPGTDGKIVSHASLHNMSTQAALLGAFSAMSVASGQYFLAQINDEMNVINLKIDKILEFLYGDKKAELVSEINFAKYAYQNYKSIMGHEAHRIATIINLQEAKKVAMKDIEFYVGDLDAVANSDARNALELESLANKAFQIRHSLNLSMQLYTMSCLLEVYYAQNMDADFLNALEDDVSAYIDKCDKRMLGSFSMLRGRVMDYKVKPFEKFDRQPLEQEIEKLIGSLNSTESSKEQDAIRSAIKSAAQKAEYVIDRDGNVYYKKSIA